MKQNKQIEIKKKTLGQQIKAFAAKLMSQLQHLGPHTVEGENQFPKAVL